MLIVIQGGSASGKTWLAQKISKDLEIGLLSKDNIKELLFDNLGLPKSPEESQIYGKATMRAFYDVIDELLKADSSRNLIVESTFVTEYADSDFRNLSDRYHPGMLQLYVTVEKTERLRRFQNRKRHTGHLDSQREEVISEESLKKYLPLAIERTIIIDTTDFDDQDYRQLLDQIKGELK